MPAGDRFPAAAGPDHPEKRSGPGKNVLIKKDEKQASVLKRSGQKHQDKKAQHLS